MIQGRKVASNRWVIQVSYPVDNRSLLLLERALGTRAEHVPPSCLAQGVKELGHQSLVESRFQGRANSSSFRISLWAGGADASGQRQHSKRLKYWQLSLRPACMGMVRVRDMGGAQKVFTKTE